MSSIRVGDEEFHHTDGSHRWSGGPADDEAQALYQVALHLHLDEHHRPAMPLPVSHRRSRLAQTGPPTNAPEMREAS